MHCIITSKNRKMIALFNYERIFESVVNSNYYQTFDIERVQLLEGKMDGAYYCADMIPFGSGKLACSAIADELKRQLYILSEQYYNKGSFSEDDRIVYNEILQEISDVYEALTYDNYVYLSTNREIIVNYSNSIKKKYNIDY